MRLAYLAAVPAAAAVVLLATGCGGPASAAAPSTTPAPSHTGKAGHGDHKGVRGKVTAENGSTWTLTTAKNRTVTVTLTPQTAFGTKKTPATVAQFPVGSDVRVAGTKQGDGFTATRISAPAAPATAVPAPGGPTA